MCKYCEMNEDGLGESIFDMPLDFGIAGDWLHLDIAIYREEESRDYGMDAYIFDSATYSPDKEIFDNIKISYCPVCGRKLSKED